MRIRGVDFVMFQVKDLASAVRFYRDVLTLPLEIYSEDCQWAEFNCGNVTLALKGSAFSPGRTAGVRLALAVDDMQEAYDKLSKKGVPIISAPQDHGCCRHLEIGDPDGHVVILHQRADGTVGQNVPAVNARQQCRTP